VHGVHGAIERKVRTMEHRKLIKKYGFVKNLRICDELTKSVRDVVRFNRHDGTRGRLELRASAYHDSRELERQLRDADAILPDDKEEHRKLLEAIAKVQPRKRRTLLARAGWLNNLRGFCIGNRILGQAQQGAMPPSKRKGKRVASIHLSVGGTSDGWRRKVSVLARESNLLLFLMSIPFAAPLLRPLRQSSFGIVLSGRTRVGKTLATLLAASAHGLGRPEDMLSWSMSDARLEELLPEWNDLMMPIDDFMTMRGKEAEKLTRIEDLAYRLATGREYDRHSSFKGAAEAGEWRTILVTQSEESVAEMARRVRQERKGGAAQRLLDLPMLDHDQPDIFDLYAKRMRARPTLEWQLRFFEKIIERCSRYHGAAFDAYMLPLITDGEEAFISARADQKAFLEEVVGPFDGAEARDLAMKFGIVYAGSCRAVEYGIVAWSHEEALNAARVCYRRARALLPDDGLLLQDGLERLRGTLISLPVVRVKKVERELPEKAVGFRERNKDIRRCVISVEALAPRFSSTRQQQLVLQWCADNKRLTLAKVKDQRDGLCPKEQFFWPDGRRKRSYEFSIPVSAHI
jgi:hypothetical protein